MILSTRCAERYFCKYIYGLGISRNAGKESSNTQFSLHVQADTLFYMKKVLIYSFHKANCLSNMVG